MNNKDRIYIETLKSEVDKLLSLPIDELKLFDNYGTINIHQADLIIHIGWWKYKVSENVYHFVFKTSRRSFLMVYTPFLDGIKIINNKIERLIGKELGEYD